MSSLSRPMGSDVDMDGSVVPLIYTDMHNHWARFTVGKLSSRGSIKGYEDQTFRPDNRITKGEFAAMFVRAVATETEVEAAVAADASASEGCKVCFPEHWSYPYLRYLAGVGAIPSGDAQWEPNIPCSRRDAISAMWALTVRPAKSETPRDRRSRSCRAPAALRTRKRLWSGPPRTVYCEVTLTAPCAWTKSSPGPRWPSSCQGTWTFLDRQAAKTGAKGGHQNQRNPLPRCRE